MFEEINFSKIKLETVEILYAGILSGGAAFALQLFGQRNISAAPAAIVMSLEGVVAAIAAWIILNQILDLNNIIGCACLYLVEFCYLSLYQFMKKTTNKLLLHINSS